MQRPKLAFQTALNYLKSRIASGDSGDNRRLQNIDHLAAQAGVSRMSMWKAVKQLAAQGVLSIRHGSGVFIGEAPLRRGSEMEPTVHKWERVKRELTSDTVQGAFRASEHLPSSKELAARYGVNYRTMRKAVQTLIDERVIAHSGARYRVVRRTLGGQGSSIVLITDDQLCGFMEFGFYSARTFPFMLALEHECTGRNIRLDRLTFAQVRRDGVKPDGVLGFILWTGAGTPEPVDDLVSALGLTDRPSVVVDIAGDLSLPASHLRTRNIRAFRLADRAAGVAAGRFLLECGHRHVAFFSQRSLDMWSARRLDGIREAFADAELDSSDIEVHQFDASPPPPNPPQSGPDLPGEGETGLRQAVSLVKESSLEDIVKLPLVFRLSEAEYFNTLAKVLAPRLDKVLQNRRITAWVADSDSLAVYALLPFLKERGVHVPARLSVMCFENSTVTLQSGLTTVDFNVHSVAYRAIDFVLSDPQSTRRSEGRGSVAEIEPVLIRRNTTGAATASQK